MTFLVFVLLLNELLFSFSLALELMMHKKILKVLAVLSLIGWVATFFTSVNNWGSKVDAPIRMASEAGNILEVYDYLTTAASNARELVSRSQRNNPEFKRWIAVVASARDSAFAADSTVKARAAFDEAKRIHEYELPPFGVSLPGNPWLFWGWGFISLVAFGVSAVAGRKASPKVHGEPTRQSHLHAWHAD